MNELQMQLTLVNAMCKKLEDSTSKLKSLMNLRSEQVKSILKEKPEEKRSWISTIYDDEIDRVRADIKRWGFNLRKETLALEKMTKGYRWYDDIAEEEYNV